ncbi:site-2 protease. Metallo peptidase. MEROPS family M50B [Marinobacter daqiaonensis]|uniref:Zinc metalloprotease n=1 Tax=Marinobacter daqiaonensis TaxID=650891 RepID=A0A1I6H8K8_9GAMM|nr:RIP metalloprotease RseP [Marinobacter daqiaonensis]SFR50654.1 site-2 protease. Metallo peptidase. MEROPS family M50B [Marinobacter daqiaonensis]
MLEILQTILALIVTLGILVTVHEFGHFWVARRCGVRVIRFSVGFGNPLYSWYDRHGTEFAIAAIPLGGYVKMLDEREGPVPEDQRHEAFTSKPPGKRIAIAAAGPAANFIFAIAAYWLLSVVGFTTLAPIAGEVEENSIADRLGLESGMEILEIDGRQVTSWRDINMGLLERAGEESSVTFTVSDGQGKRTLSTSLGGWQLPDDNPDPLGQFGLQPKRPDVPPVLGEVVQGSRAEQAGLQAGDRILRVDGKPVGDWFELVEYIQRSPEQTLELLVERDGNRVTLSVTPGVREVGGTEQGYVGAGVAEVSWPEEMMRDVRYGPLAAIPHAVSETWSDTRLTLVAIQKMVTGLLSPTNLSGPITIARVAEQSVSSGFQDFIHFLAYLSVSLGILNLLPIPVLDGGHIVYYTIEAIRRRPLSEQTQAIGLRIGLAMILTLMVFALYNDLMRL